MAVSQQLAAAACRPRQVAHLDLIIIAQHGCLEIDARRQVIEAELLQVFRIAIVLLQLLEWPERLGVRRIAISEITLIILGRLILCLRVMRAVLIVSVPKREVRRIIRHRVLTLDIYTDIIERETLDNRLVDRIRLDGIALRVRIQVIQRLRHLDILVQGIILRRGCLFRIGIIERDAYLRLLGEELTQLQRGGDTELRIIIHPALRQGLIQRSETGSLDTSTRVDRTQIRERHAQVRVSRPTAILIEIGHTKLIDPDLTTLDLIRVVTHTDHDHLDLSQTWVTNDADRIAGIILVSLRIDLIETYASFTLTSEPIALQLQVGPGLQLKVEHIFRRPDLLLIGAVVRIIRNRAVRRQVHRDLILVVVVLIIGTHTDEDGQVAIRQALGLIDRSLGMSEHLQTLVTAQVVRGRLINRPGITRRQIRNLQGERLLVLLQQLRLAGIEHTADSRRQHVVDRLTLSVLLDINRRNHQLTIRDRRYQRIREILLISTPVATNQFERTETQIGRFLETGHIHTHETDRLKVTDRTNLLVITLDRDLEEIPFNRLLRAIHHGNFRLTLVYDIVDTNLQITRPQGDLVFEILLRAVQRIVLINIFHIRRTLSGAGITLGRFLGVTLRSVIAFVAREDIQLLGIIIRSAEIMIVITRRVVKRRERIIHHLGERLT